MNISSNYPVMIFASEFNDKRHYKVGLSKKDMNGNYINGYKDVRFKKDVFIHNKTKIKIKSAWLDFYIKDNKTIDYIFINDIEIVEENRNDAPEEFYEVSDEELPF